MVWTCLNYCCFGDGIWSYPIRNCLFHKPESKRQTKTHREGVPLRCCFATAFFGCKSCISWSVDDIARMVTLDAWHHSGSLIWKHVRMIGSMIDIAGHDAHRTVDGELVCLTKKWLPKPPAGMTIVCHISYHLVSLIPSAICVHDSFGGEGHPTGAGVGRETQGVKWMAFKMLEYDGCLDCLSCTFRIFYVDVFRCFLGGRGLGCNRSVGCTVCRFESISTFFLCPWPQLMFLCLIWERPPRFQRSTKILSLFDWKSMTPVAIHDIVSRFQSWIRLAAMLSCCLRPLVTPGRHIATRHGCSVARCAHKKLPQLMLPTSRAHWHGDLQIDHNGYQRKLAVVSRRLKEYLKQQRPPSLTHLEIEDRRFPLPIKFEDLDSELVARLGAIDDEYLAGFFDGDGCISVETGLSGCFLQVGQSAQNSRMLFLFLAKYGGSIVRHGQGYGSASPSVSWRLCGEAARQACSILESHCLVKKEQLCIAMSWPVCKDEKKVCHARLRDLKMTMPIFTWKHTLSWTYLAGFFDAEGCITLSAQSKNLRLEIGQRHPEILQAIREFLVSELASEKSGVKLYESDRNRHLLVSTRSATSITILRNLLAHGLQGKRPAALQALRLPNSTHSQLRRELALGKGKQSFFTKLDDQGCARACEIHKAQKRLQRALNKNNIALVGQLRTELAGAKLEHQVLNAQTQIQKLRSFIMSMPKMVMISPFRTSRLD